MRPGTDTPLKLRLAALSGEAARVLAHGTLRACADVRVRNAVQAALADPTLSDSARREIVGLSGDLSEDEDATRDVTLRFRVTDDESQLIRDQAESAGQTVSDYLRRAALQR